MAGYPVVDEGGCEARLVHGRRVADIRPLLPDADALQAEAERLRAVADPTRLTILLALSLAELCVCDIANLAGVTQTCASQHLKILRAYRLVRFRKQGRMAFYRLADPSLAGWLAGLTTATGGASLEQQSR
jgi:DNA-binding transcriptional ArsR family regulator